MDPLKRRARKNPGVVGIWHETYVSIEPTETIYVGTPAMGLPKATAVVRSPPTRIGLARGWPTVERAAQGRSPGSE